MREVEWTGISFQNHRVTPGLTRDPGLERFHTLGGQPVRPPWIDRRAQHPVVHSEQWIPGRARDDTGGCGSLTGRGTSGWVAGSSPAMTVDGAA